MVPNICWWHSTLLTLVVIPNLIHAHAPSRSPGIDIGVSHFRFSGQLPVTFLKLCTTTFYCEFIDTSFVEIGCVVWPGILWREAILYIDDFWWDHFAHSFTHQPFHCHHPHIYGFEFISKRCHRMTQCKSNTFQELREQNEPEKEIRTTPDTKFFGIENLGE